MNTMTATPARQTIPRRTRLLRIGSAIVALGTVVLGVGSVYVFSTQPQQVAVSDASGVANFNFRVTGIPVPGVVPGVKVKANWNPASLGKATATINVDLEKLNTGIALRDQHAKEFLGVPKHPTAVFKLQALEGVESLKPGGQAKATARGSINLNGVDHLLSAPTTLALNEAGDRLEVSTKFDVAFADYKIVIPGADPKTDVTVKFRLPVRK